MVGSIKYKLVYKKSRTKNKKTNIQKENLLLTSNCKVFNINAHKIAFNNEDTTNKMFKNIQKPITAHIPKASVSVFI